MYETVNLNDLFDVDGVYTCSSDNEEVAQAVNCNIYAISGGSAKIKIEYKETEAGEVLDEKTITVNVSKLKMVVTNFPNELTMDINDTYKLFNFDTTPYTESGISAPYLVKTPYLVITLFIVINNARTVI